MNEDTKAQRSYVTARLRIKPLSSDDMFLINLAKRTKQVYKQVYYKAEYERK